MPIPTLIWIHGPKASGKTVIANLIAKSTDNQRDSRFAFIYPGTTEAAICRVLTSHTHVIFEEFKEKRNPSASLVAALTPGNSVAIDFMHAGLPAVRHNKIKATVIIVISLAPPKHHDLRSRFHIVETKAPERGLLATKTSSKTPTKPTA